MDEKQNEKLTEEQSELGSWTREMIKPENLDPRVFHTTEELMKSLWDEE